MTGLRRAFLDTNVYIDWMNAGLREDLVLGRGYVRYLSAVVAMELRVGARTRAASRSLDKLLEGYEAAGRLIAPSSSVFRRAGAVLARLHSAGREVRRASLVGDVLIALTCRGFGATLYTADGGDFGAIRKVEDFALEVV
ncbi:MAG: PIN domain-containing protein [Deltaproteobacteria bacterium]|nr:PIN domain-containing protein [Deltaproteobacteria bacterium]